MIHFLLDLGPHGHQYILNIASWFLLALFLVNIVYILIRKIAIKLKIWNDNIFTVIFFIGSIAAVYLSQKTNVENYIPILRTMFFMFFYQLGYIYKDKIEGRVKINTIIYFLILVLTQIFLFKVDGNLTYEAVFMKFESKYIITPIISSVTGILFWFKVSEILVPSLGNSKIVNYISNNTNDIMQHHLFWIFAINFIIFKFADKFNLSGFDSTQFKNTIYYFYTFGTSQAYIIYTIIAIAMPIIVRYIWELLKEQIIRYMHKWEGYFYEK